MLWSMMRRAQWHKNIWCRFTFREEMVKFLGHKTVYTWDVISIPSPRFFALGTSRRLMCVTTRSCNGVRHAPWLLERSWSAPRTHSIEPHMICGGELLLSLWNIPLVPLSNGIPLQSLPKLLRPDEEWQAQGNGAQVSKNRDARNRLHAQRTWRVSQPGLVSQYTRHKIPLHFRNRFVKRIGQDQLHGLNNALCLLS